MGNEMKVEEEAKRGNKGPNPKEDWGKSCGLWVLIALGFFVLIFITFLGIGVATL